MALTTAAVGLTVEQWDAKFFKEYVDESRFMPYMGTGENNVIQVKSDLTKKKGETINFALVNRLTGNGVTGNATLEGSEEDMLSRSFKLDVDKIRNGVIVAEIDEQYSAIPLRQAAKPTLKVWMKEVFRDNIITALGSVNGVAYATAIDAQKDTWKDGNADRVLYGDAKANAGAGTHALALATLDNTDDQLTPAAISLMKRIALSADPKIRPILTTEDEDWYVMFANSLSFRDLSNNAVMTQANRDAMARGKNNPLFTGGDLIWDGVVIKEVMDIPIDTSSTIDIGPAYLCGAQAVGIGWAKKTTTRDETFDYGDKVGCAIEEIRGIGKLTFGTGAGDTTDPKDHGMVTGFFAAVADA